MRVKLSPQVSEKRVSYAFEDKKVTCTMGEQVEEFDFTGLPDGAMTSTETTLLVNPIKSAVIEDGVLYLELLNFILSDATEEERFPKWFNPLNVDDDTVEEQEIVDLEVVKVWEGEERERVTIILCVDGVETDKTIMLDEQNHWSGSFNNLPKYNMTRKVIGYDIVETDLTGYESSITGDINKGFVVTNTKIKTDIVEEEVEIVIEGVDEGGEDTVGE